ncbi:hypothetical protein VOLCADRAFT_94426 [Volvox carteri f. nagariensis]|uniref:Uncharacterized protein n=1 Tax=Volvox carteri f. nagariensis TaxID=3068 RepID=D8U4S1_VOLCA|nr:uncharacterized protein VOLCADRAFT_94426 [Volvox carteri f. nagariensis]EFJ45239.1 hypothetical protein VOLCADRAFT_94426 [Volvox carteri f. nagariensis]|eukprot:XP_002953615.1 hypothetical protein VOLCADRAFT_94426 [Volvox carteri f. nagariensis]
MLQQLRKPRRHAPADDRRMRCANVSLPKATTLLLLVSLLFFACASATSTGQASGITHGGGYVSRRGSNSRSGQPVRQEHPGLDFDLGTTSAGFHQSSVPETQALQGGNGGIGRRLRQQLQQPLAATFEMGSFAAPIITIALMHVPTAGPRSRKYFAFWRPYNASHRQSAATFDLDSRKVSLMNNSYDQFCNGPIVQPDGNPLVVGGYNDPANKIQYDGRKWITAYSDRKRKLFPLVQMAYPRWYPTPCLTADKKVLIVGGTVEPDKGPQIPIAELWDPTRPTRTPTAVEMPPAFKATAGLNWYPFIVLLPRGEVAWWGDRGGSITDKDWKEIYTFPSLPSTFPYRTMYKYTSSIVLNAMKPDTTTGEYNSFSITIFGGAPDNAVANSPASNVSARIDMYYCGTGICDNGWVIESMVGQRRVMSTTTVLPNGKVLVHGGGQAGTAGWRKKGRYQGTLPAYQDLVYDPDAPEGSRYTLSDSIGIIHMYHASSCLDLSGKVMSSGCETCGMTGADAGNLPSSIIRSPDRDPDLDYRISFMVPTEIAPPVVRPVITAAPTTVLRGSVFNVTYANGPITGATLAAPCANTHSINMNQRVVFLNMVSDAGGVAFFCAPPLSQPSAAHAGYYQLFLLGANTATGRTYSEGVWIYLADE